MAGKGGGKTENNQTNGRACGSCDGGTRTELKSGPDGRTYVVSTQCDVCKGSRKA